MYGPSDYRNDPYLAIPDLAKYLRSGSLSLSLGSGISEGLGLPLWPELVERCLKKTNILKSTALTETLPAGASNKDLCNLIDGVESAFGEPDLGHNQDYRTLVHDCLFDGVAEYGLEILRKDLLIALGALLMGSNRGSIKEVFNFNFDDVLNWYLRLHGFDTKIITVLPTLHRAADVTLYHPNGYLPKVMKLTESSDFLIFSQHSYDDRLEAGYWDAWTYLFRTALMHRVMLFVGLSGEDQTFGPSLVGIKKKVKDRPTGFWMFGPGAEEGTITNLSLRNIMPLCFDSYDDYPKFLLAICQEALNT